ncbi:hypothetical protein A2870_00640 [Candidatus Curtissbacteria bacterium RIFCSPHIGHO2_01_FULL_41_11]|uniref:HAD family phosphatase n=1 Tax=Candidatus Curtissbacteria bacterium RIFCSPHIGHO2_01_FULL_41_11 TaxID=1797711 RepID=A0A1F5G3D1_9BACT|nr:MAG: hypothetical protein A2870_00640 [Candidatus Curtissbacteria bacterium RIFCSPHIGHO2_01_FULL_41_11]
MIKAIIFDLGGVVLRHTYENTFELMGNFFGIEDIKVQEFYEKYKNDWTLGRLNVKKVAKLFQNITSGEKTIASIIETWQKIHESQVDIDKQVIKIIKKLKKDYKIYLLSNTIDLHFNAIGKTGIYELFDKVFTSFTLGLKKPDQEIFLHVLKKIRVKPSGVIFIDDKIANIESANSVGIHSILFKGSKSLASSLKKSGVKI